MPSCATSTGPERSLLGDADSPCSSLSPRHSRSSVLFTATVAAQPQPAVWLHARPARTPGDSDEQAFLLAPTARFPPHVTNATTAQTMPLTLLDAMAARSIVARTGSLSLLGLTMALTNGTRRRRRLFARRGRSRKRGRHHLSHRRRSPERCRDGGRLRCQDPPCGGRHSHARRRRRRQ